MIRTRQLIALSLSLALLPLIVTRAAAAADPPAAPSTPAVLPDPSAPPPPAPPSSSPTPTPTPAPTPAPTPTPLPPAPSAPPALPPPVLAEPGLSPPVPEPLPTLAPPMPPAPPMPLPPAPAPKVAPPQPPPPSVPFSPPLAPPASPEIAAQVGPPATAVTPPVAPVEPEEKSQMRLRGGFSLNGGLVHTPDGNGPAFGLAGRLGVQFNSYFGLYYQNTPLVTFAPSSAGQSVSFHAGFADYNTILGSLTLLDMVELAVGPSVDYAKYADCSAGVTGFVPTSGCQSGSSVALGGHARVSFDFGGLFGDGKTRRSGFLLNADIHPLLFSDLSAFSATVGLGAEWY